MKTLAKSVALVAVTTLFATAFSTSQHSHFTTVAVQPDSTAPVAQVVILGKRMTSLEKVQYDLELAATGTSNEAVANQNKQQTAAVNLAVK